MPAVTGEVPARDEPNRMGAAAAGGQVALRVRGNAALPGLPALAVSGSRDADGHALRIAAEAGAEAARAGLAVVTGDARGVDDAAQYGALRAGGSIVSVLARGLRGWNPRPRYRFRLTGDNWAALSEWADGDGWAAWRAMRRNATIVRLARAMFVAHVRERSGTSAAAAECLDVGKPLFVAVRRGGDAGGGAAALIAKGEDPVSSMGELRRAIRGIAAAAGAEHGGAGSGA